MSTRVLRFFALAVSACCGFADAAWSQNAERVSRPGEYRGYSPALCDDHRASKALTYATPPLSADLQITGHPVANLWASSTASDGDFVVYLEDVAPDGKATSYNMDGPHSRLASQTS